MQIFAGAVQIYEPGDISLSTQADYSNLFPRGSANHPRPIHDLASKILPLLQRFPSNEFKSADIPPLPPSWRALL